MPDVWAKFKSKSFLVFQLFSRHCGCTVSSGCVQYSYQIIAGLKFAMWHVWLPKTQIPWMCLSSWHFGVFVHFLVASLKLNSCLNPKTSTLLLSSRMAPVLYARSRRSAEVMMDLWQSAHSLTRLLLDIVKASFCRKTFRRISSGVRRKTNDMLPVFESLQ